MNDPCNYLKAFKRINLHLNNIYIYIYRFKKINSLRKILKVEIMSRLIEEENKKKSLKNQNHNGEQDSEDDDDEDDEDFVPNELADQSESEDDLKEDDLAENKTKKGGKRKLKKKNGSDEDEDESGEVEEDEETDPKVKKTNGTELGEFDKKKADDLWSSFLKDVKSTTSSSSSSTTASNAKKYESQTNQIVNKTIENEKKIEDKTVKDIFENFKSKIVPNNDAESKPVGVLNSSVKTEEVKK